MFTSYTTNVLHKTKSLPNFMFLYTTNIGWPLSGTHQIPWLFQWEYQHCFRCTFQW